MPRGLKRLSYRVQGSTTQAAQAAHWEGFTWSGGPWQVVYRGPWGSWQVWASSEAEGRRVLKHACSAAGVDPEDPAGAWWVAEVAHPRFQRVTTYKTATKYGLPVVTVRDGPSGSPLIGL